MNGIPIGKIPENILQDVLIFGITVNCGQGNKLYHLCQDRFFNLLQRRQFFLFIFFHFLFNPVPARIRNNMQGSSTHGRLVFIRCSWIGKTTNITCAASGFENFLQYTDFVRAIVANIQGFHEISMLPSKTVFAGPVL